jgi:hypothetical protein
MGKLGEMTIDEGAKGQLHMVPICLVFTMELIQSATEVVLTIG